MNLGKEVADLFGVDTKISNQHWSNMDDNTRRLFIQDILYAAGFSVNKADIIDICKHKISKEDCFKSDIAKELFDKLEKIKSILS